MGEKSVNPFGAPNNDLGRDLSLRGCSQFAGASVSVINVGGLEKKAKLLRLPDEAVVVGGAIFCSFLFYGLGEPAKP
jgi:hypothetical protein